MIAQSMKEVFVITSKVWKYTGPAGWYFVYVDNKASERIKKLSQGKKKVGFGFIPIRATVGDTSWETTLFPTKEGPYLIALKAAVRKKEGIDEGDQIRLSLSIL